MTDTCRREWLVTYSTCTAFWLPFMAFTFRFAAPDARVRLVAGANMMWNVLIDFIAHRGPSGPEET